MLHRVPLGVTLILALSACKPTIIEDPEPADPPPQQVGPIVDPLVEQEAVRVAVREYSSALRKRKAEAVTTHVVPETFVLYEDLRLAALRFDRDELEHWDLLSILLVLQIRAAVSKAELEQLDGRGLFELGVVRGLVGEGVDDVSLDEVWIADDASAAQIRLDGTPIVWLRKTGEADADTRWCVDIPEMIRLLGPAVEAEAREQVDADGKVRTAYTLLLLSSEGPIAFDIVDGPLSRDAEPTDAK